jgi:putative transposase
MEPHNLEISISRQCELLALAWSTYYYQTRPPSELNLLLMRLIDEQYTKTPFYGVPRITKWLPQHGY